MYHENNGGAETQINGLKMKHENEIERTICLGCSGSIFNHPAHMEDDNL